MPERDRHNGRSGNAVDNTIIPVEPASSNAPRINMGVALRLPWAFRISNKRKNTKDAMPGSNQIK